MDRWPSDDRETTVQADKTKGKDKSQNISFGYPVLEHGALNSATLAHAGKHLEWKFICGDSEKRRLVPKGTPVQLFPETRPRPFRDADVSVSRCAEQGAHDLRTYYPDMQFSAELIKDELIADARNSQALNRFDPYSGRRIMTFSWFDGKGEESAFLAFPMGETCCDLNISSLTYSRTAHVSLKSSAQPVRSFQTPILQLSSSVSSFERGRRPGTILGVRTLGATSLLEFKSRTSTSRSWPEKMETNELMNVLRSDVGDKRLADMVLLSSMHALAFVVNDAGAVYKCHNPQGDKLVQLMYPRPLSDTVSEDVFWRLGRCHDDDNCLLINGTTAKYLDFRTQDSALDLYRIQRSGELLTSVEALQEDRIVCLATTQQVLWIDSRHPRKPLMAVVHGRDYDRTLSTESRFLAQSPMTFLTSHRTGLVTIYDVSREQNNLMQLKVPPYALPPAHVPDGRHLGTVLFQHPDNPTVQDISVLQLSERGGIHMVDLQVLLSDNMGDATIDSPVEWSLDVQQLAQRIESSGIDMGVRGARSFSQTDMRDAYKKLFVTKQDVLSRNLDAVYSLLENMPSFWQIQDTPVETTLTTFDIALRSGSDPTDPVRSDFFTDSPINTVRGYRALAQGRIPTEKLIKQAPWHVNIQPFLRHFIPDIHAELEAMSTNLHRYDLSQDSRLGSSFRAESEAREQLLLDLYLSSDVFAPRQFSGSTEASIGNAVDAMSSAAGAMSLDESEPSQMQFHFLHPVPKGSINHYPDDAVQPVTVEEEASFLPHGINLLLQDWTVGADPRVFTYYDPYNIATEIGEALPAMRRRAATQPPDENSGMQAQRPLVFQPTVAAPPTLASSQPVVSRKPLFAPRSQDTFESRPRPPRLTDSDWRGASSQEFIASTQVLPGPHGGRSLSGKKKTLKKRVAGF